MSSGRLNDTVEGVDGSELPALQNVYNGSNSQSLSIAPAYLPFRHVNGPTVRLDMISIDPDLELHNVPALPEVGVFNPVIDDFANPGFLRLDGGDPHLTSHARILEGLLNWQDHAPSALEPCPSCDRTIQERLELMLDHLFPVSDSNAYQDMSTLQGSPSDCSQTASQASLRDILANQEMEEAMEEIDGTDSLESSETESDKALRRRERKREMDKAWYLRKKANGGVTPPPKVNKDDPEYKNELRLAANARRRAKMARRRDAEKELLRLQALIANGEVQLPTQSEEQEENGH